jgi:hypothetical protein
MAVAEGVTLDCGDNRGAIGGILLRLLMFAANDVASPCQRHRLGFIVDLLAALAEHQRHERSGGKQIG